MATIDITTQSGAVGNGDLQLQNGAPMDGTLRFVTDAVNTASPLKLSTSLVQTTSTLKITTNDNPYIDAEDGTGNNRFTIGRDSASQQVNVDFASNPTGSTTIVGAIRTYVDGVNLSEVMSFREDGKVGIGTTTPFEMMQIGSPTNRGTLNIINDSISPFIRMAAGNSGNNQSTIIGDGNGALDFKFNGTTTLYLDYQNNVSINTARLALGSKLGVRGSGSTFATTSFLVQNSSGSQLMNVTDDGSVTIGTQNGVVSIISGYNNKFEQNRLSFYSATTNIRGINAGNQGLIVSKSTGITDLYPSSIFAIDSTTQGFLPPRMTDAQIRAIATPAEGLVAYNTTISHLCCYQAGAWVKFNHSPM